jgi:hypothetical protein
MDASKDQKKKIDILEAMHYTVSAWRQIMQQTIEYCFRKADYRRGQPTDVSDVPMRNEDDDDAFYDWPKFRGTDNEKFDNYISVDSYLVTSGVNTVEELRKSHAVALSVEGKEEKGEDSEPKPTVVPNFAEVHEALMKIKSLVCVHSNRVGDHDSVLSLER